jgi:hypothetical protein
VPAQAVEGRAGSVIVVPGSAGEQSVCEASARAEPAARVVGDKRAPASAKDFGKIADLVENRGCGGIEGRRAGEEKKSLGLWPPIHPVFRDLGAKDHQERALIADSRLQRIEQSVRAAVDAA